MKLKTAMLSFSALFCAASTAFGGSTGSIEFSSATYFAAEIAGIATAIVQRTGDTSGVVSVDFQTGDGTAQAGRDFAPVSGTLTFPAGEARKSIVIPILGNGLLAGDRIFTLSLSRPTGGAVLGTNSTAAMMLLDNDSADFVDAGFHPAIGDVAVGWMMMQKDGKLLLVIQSRTGSATLGMVRLNADNSLDLGFRLDERIKGNSLHNAGVPLLQPDGKILLNVDAVLVGNLTQSGMVRLNNDGSLDPTFAPGTGGDGIYSFLVQPDGKVLVGGLAIFVDGTVQTGIARLNGDGSWDKSFTSVLGFSTDGTYGSGPVLAIAQQSDGKIVLGGYYLQVNGAAHPVSLLRLNPDGTTDDQYKPVIGDECFIHGVSTLALAADDKAIIFGCFGSVNGVPRPGFARLNLNGTTDETFEVPRDFGTISRLSPRTDGKIFCTGGPAGMFRLQSDGSLDESFLAGARASGQVYYALELPNEHVLVAGDFTSVNGIDSTGLARLVSGPNQFVRFTQSPTNAGFFELKLTAQPGKTYVFEASSDLIHWLHFRTKTAVGFTLDVADTDAANLRRRFYRAVLSP